MKRSSGNNSGSQKTPQSSVSSSKKPALKEPEESDRLFEEAYKICIPASTQKENIFPYIPISTKVEIPIENKYAGLKPYEVSEFYIRHLGLIQIAPKDFLYYQQILIETGSVIFEPTKRGHEVAYSKFIIIKVISPDEWPHTDLYTPRELKNYSPKII